MLCFVALTISTFVACIWTNIYHIDCIVVLTCWTDTSVTCTVLMLVPRNTFTLHVKRTFLTSVSDLLVHAHSVIQHFRYSEFKPTHVTKHIIGQIGDRLLRDNDPNNSVKALKIDRFLSIRLQFHQIHPTVLTIVQHLCSIKPKCTKYKHTNTNESIHSEIGPVWQNPIQRTVRTAHLSVHMTVHSFSTQYNREQFW